MLTVLLSLTALIAATLEASSPTFEPSHRHAPAPQAVSIRDFGAAGDGRKDDRPAIQAAMDAGHARRLPVVLPAGVFVLGSASQPGDRILRTYPAQRLVGAGPSQTVLRIAPNFGPYVTVIGAASDRIDIGNWQL